MSPDVFPDLAKTLAPPQIYIMFAISVATFAWLLRPKAITTLPFKALISFALFLVFQGLHAALFLFVHGVHARINGVLHSIVIAVYFGILFWSLRNKWVRSKEKPPISPGS